jgi:hypothetical protein
MPSVTWLGMSDRQWMFTMHSQRCHRSHTLCGQCCVVLVALFCFSGCGSDDSRKAVPSSVTNQDAATNPALPASDPAEGKQTSPDDAPSQDPPLASCRRWPNPDSHARPDAIATVAELENDYRTSRVGTDAKYEGKLLELSGLVVDSGKNLEGDPFVRLGRPNGRFDIYCILRSTQDLANVVDGAQCRVRGVYCVSIKPAFIHCTVIGTEGSPITARDESSAGASESDRPPPDAIITAEQLESEVTADVQQTMRKYAGKVLQVTGQLSRISHVASGAMVYRLGPPLSTQFFIRTGDPWYCARPGQSMTLVGRWFAGYPCLVNCEVISVTGTPDPILTAASLGKDLESDRVAFRKSFYLKQLIVTGEVIEKAPPESIGARPKITLRSTPTTTVVCEMEPDELIGTESVQIGDSVTIAGWNTKESPKDSINLVQCLFWRGK